MPNAASQGAARASAWPGQCAVCRAWSMGRLCAACRSRFVPSAPRCAVCALTLPGGASWCGACLRDPPPFDATVAAVEYDYPWDRLLSRLKFDAELDLAPALAGLLADAVDAAGEPAPDVVLPVPLSAARLGERGFNQAWELARRAHRSARADVLLRVRDTPHQAALPRAQRAANVRNAFAVEPRHTTRMRSADVAVVDDILTSGATAAEIARVLKAAGAARVRLWVVARTPAPDGV